MFCVCKRKCKDEIAQFLQEVDKILHGHNLYPDVVSLIEEYLPAKHFAQVYNRLKSQYPLPRYEVLSTSSSQRSFGYDWFKGSLMCTASTPVGNSLNLNVVERFGLCVVARFVCHRWEKNPFLKNFLKHDQERICQEWLTRLLELTNIEYGRIGPTGDVGTCCPSRKKGSIGISKREKQDAHRRKRRDQQIQKRNWMRIIDNGSRKC